MCHKLLHYPIFFFPLHFTVQQPHRRCLKSRVLICLYICSAEVAATAPDSWMSGHTTNIWCPAASSASIFLYNAALDAGETISVMIDLRPAGLTSSMDISSSPYSVSANERGMGVAVRLKTCG